MEIVAEYQGIDADSAIWQYFRRHWGAWFPGLASRSAFVRQAANLWQYKAMLQQHIAQQLGAYEDNIHMVDGMPMPLCQFIRAPQCRSFRCEADYGYCAAKKQTYYGFQGHLLITATGVITGFTLTAANTSKREALWEMVQMIHGSLIGDKGYLSAPLQQELRQVCINLETALRSNMQDSRDPAWVTLLKRMRRLIETVIGQLVERFSIEKVRARDLWHLTSQVNCKLLAHTVCQWLNRHRCDPLQFEQLVTD